MFFPGFSSYYSEPRYYQQYRPSTQQYYRRRPQYQAYEDSTDEEDDYGRFSQSFFAPSQQPRRAAPQQQQKQKQQQQTKQQQCSCNCGGSHPAATQKQQQKAAQKPTETSASKTTASPMKDEAERPQTAFAKMTVPSQPQNSTQKPQTQFEKEIKIVAEEELSTDDDTLIEDLDINYWEQVGVSPTKNNLDDLLIEEYFTPEIENKARKLESVLKRPFGECLHFVQEHPDESISSLIQLAIKKYTNRN